MPSVVSIHATLRSTTRDFKKFEKEIRKFYHNELHCCIQGTMELASASNSPEFLFHHAFMDKIWYDWQAKGPEYKFKLDDNMDSQLRGSSFAVGQFMDSFNLVNQIAVYYEDPFPGYQRLHATLSRLHPGLLQMLDSYHTGVKKRCCPKSPEAIEAKIEEIAVSKKNIPKEVAKDYGESNMVWWIFFFIQMKSFQ